MNKLIKKIIRSESTMDEKYKLLNSLAEEIEMAKSILSGKYKYCPHCDEYYLTKSYLTEKETKEAKICIWDDPINSGGNEYRDGYVDITYEICPKGHINEIEREERGA